MDSASFLKGLRERPTLRDVALRVGVSVNTASFVLNSSKSGTRVSEKTKEAIWEAAAELGYQPNAVARSLRNQRTGTFGFYTDFDPLGSKNMFLSELIGGIQDGCLDREVDLLLHRMPHATSADSIATALLDNRVDGLIFFAPPGNELAERLANCSLPVVAVVDLVENLPIVRVDDEQGGRLQAEYLAERGHKRVMYRQIQGAPISSRMRMDGFEARAYELGISVVRGRRLDRPYLDGLVDSDFALIRGGCTAIVCWEDNSAFGTAAALTEAGYRVPEDIEVVGFNGLPSAVPCKFAISTVVAPWRAVGAAAAHILHDLVNGRPVQRHTVLPVHFSSFGQSDVPKEEQ